jgi:hypothetical protein
VPGIFRIRCSRCEGPQLRIGSETFDTRKDGVVLLDSHVVFKQDDGQFLALRHPGESYDLEKLGWTWEKAKTQQRLFRVTYKICQQCSCVNEEKEHVSGEAGCGPAVVAMALAFAALKFWAGNSGARAGIGAFGIGCLMYPASNFFYKLRFKKPNAQLRVHGCAQCGSTNLITLSGAHNKNVICPACKNQSLSITNEGIS